MFLKEITEVDLRVVVFGALTAFEDLINLHSYNFLLAL
jgi:hypothetical protein